MKGNFKHYVSSLVFQVGFILYAIYFSAYSCTFPPSWLFGEHNGTFNALCVYSEPFLDVFILIDIPPPPLLWVLVSCFFAYLIIFFLFFEMMLVVGFFFFLWRGRAG